MSRRGSPPHGLRRPLRSLAAWTGASVLRSLSALVRLRELHKEREKDALSRYGSVIYAFWHGRGFLLAGRVGRRGTAVLVSLSEDGEMIARASRRLGFHPVRGSSSRRGREGLAELERALAEGRPVAITPDGPRGPRHRAQMGAVVLAARSGKPILPMGVSARPAWTLGSWDAFQVPRPGARGAVVYGDAILVPAAADLEPWRMRLEEALNAAEAEADREVAP